MIILHADTNHPTLMKKLEEAGHHNIEGYEQTREETLQNQHLYDGIVIRSRYKIDREFIDAAPNIVSSLKLSGRLRLFKLLRSVFLR